MHRYKSLLLNLIVVAGLGLGTLPLGLVIATSQLPSSVVSVASEVTAAPALAGKGGKHKHKQKHKDRKQKERKQDHQRKRQKDRQPGQPDELPTGVLPAAGTVDPDVDGHPVSAKNHYIVLLKSSAGDALNASSTIASGKSGVTPTFVYRYVFNGFAAVIPPDQLDAVRNDPRVEAVVSDRVVTASTRTIPTGINRIDAEENATTDIDGTDERVDVDVAVLDTEGKSTHPDLNQYAWANCTPSHNNFDDYGHGTHVSGTIGALDNGVNVNGVDVVGVAPGARLWNIKVLVNGYGLDSWIICGLDLVAQYSSPQSDGLGDIEVANMSLGGEVDPANPTDACGSGLIDPEHEAICNVVNAGVTMVVAAGNETDDAANYAPASYGEVITVSALADSDGEPGAHGPNTSFDDPDDSFAFFSNYGADVDIAAPGEDILSTVPTGSCAICDPSGYTEISGTSMATPHVAGAAALYLATHPGQSPAQVKTALLNARVTGPIPGDNNDTIDEGILNVGTGSGIGTAMANDTSLSVSAKKDRTSSEGANARKHVHHKSKKKR
jgi:subtilisin family serine protease